MNISFLDLCEAVSSQSSVLDFLRDRHVISDAPLCPSCDIRMIQAPRSRLVNVGFVWKCPNRTRVNRCNREKSLLHSVLPWRVHVAGSIWWYHIKYFQEFVNSNFRALYTVNLVITKWFHGWNGLFSLRQLEGCVLRMAHSHIFSGGVFLGSAKERSVGTIFSTTPILY